jgi:hypothetical protein
MRQIGSLLASMARCSPLRRVALIVLAACTALLLAGSVSAGTGRARAAACRPGTTKVEGHRATRFCGPASVAIHAGKHWFRLSGGSCTGTSKFFTVNVGTAVIAQNQKIPYFGLTVGQYPSTPKTRKPAGTDGVYHLGVVVVRWHGGAWDISGYVRIILWGDRSGGRFAGRTSAYPHASVSGTFSC